VIFVTVGSHYQGFDRLIKKMDEIAGKIDEKVIMQIGHTEYKPVNAEYFDFTDYSRMKQLNKEARVVVSHAGVGSIITALEEKTPLIIVPRKKMYSEVIDDHQFEIAEALNLDSRVHIVTEVEDLDTALEKKIEFLGNSNRKVLTSSIKQYLSSSF